MRHSRFTKTCPRGVTLVELIIAIIIITVLLSVALLTLAGNRHKQNLQDTVNGIVDLLNRAASESSSQLKIKGVCFKNGVNGPYFQIYDPTLNAAGLPTDVDCGSGEVTDTKFEFRPDVSLCTNCDSYVDFNKSLFFKPGGIPINSSGALAGYEICVIHGSLAPGTRAREVEVTTGGVIQAVKPGQTGDLTGVTANTGNCQ